MPRRNGNARSRPSVPPVSATVAWEAKVQQYGGLCCYCRQPAKPLTRDHVIPRVHGGTDDIDNLVPACRSCNSRKGAQNVYAWVARMNSVPAELTYLDPSEVRWLNPPALRRRSSKGKGAVCHK